MLDCVIFCKTVGFTMQLLVCLLLMLGYLSNGELNHYDVNLKEYCMLSSFQPSCKQSEVINMHHALFGRMGVGKCIKKDFHLGCSVNVIQITDKRCSGVNSCSIDMPNTEMRNALKCLDESLTAYLEAGYSCQKVHMPRSQTCRSPEKISATIEPTYIASSTSLQTSCGLHGSPWIIEALPGQNILMHIIDFGWENKTETCPKNYGYILDMESNDVINICGGTQREKYLYHSFSHSLQIILELNALENNNFLLEFKAVGCPEYTPPDHTWIQKENDSLVIGCVSSENSWKLTCMDNRWLGVVGNCSKPTGVNENLSKDVQIGEIPRKVTVKSTSSHVVPRVSNNHVLVFTMACLTLVMCCVIVILGVFCTKRYDVKIKKYQQGSYVNDERVTLPSNATIATYRPIPMGIQMANLNHSSESEFGTMIPPAYTFPLQKTGNQGPQVPPRNEQPQSKKGSMSKANGSAYGNVSNAEDIYDVDSVQYYILENPAELQRNSSVSEQGYQNITEQMLK